MKPSLTPFAFLLPVFAPSAHTQSPIVELDTGPSQATTHQATGSASNVSIFLGLPFAAPPVGPLRFSPPQPPPRSNSTKIHLASEPPPACIQNGGNSKLPESEDCLYLNIYAPSPFNTTSAKTVMVWLYGGGLQYGSSSQPLYNGTNLASNQDVIIVVPNYRLNIFGFPGPISCIPPKDRNLGLLDQRLALAWVQQNIFKFGGDARKVTVFGESAGARSADFHLLTMRENPPFRAVIMQSGSAELTPLADMNKAAESAKKGTAFQQLARAFACPADDGKVALECLRAIPATAIKQKMKELALYSGSVEDGGLATVQDQATIRQTHQAANVPLLLGTNADEMRGSLRSYNTSSLSSYLNSTFPTHQSLIPKLLNAYTPSPSTPYQTPFDAIAALATDLSFTCITSREAHISTTSSYPTYRYLFTASYPNTQKFPGSGANHAHEIQFIFGNLPKDSTNEESDLSTLMQNTWARFAKNPDAGPGWVRYGITAGGKDMGRFDSDGELRIVSSGGVDRNCHLFEEMYAGRA